MNTPHTITVGELRKALEFAHDDDRLFFGSGDLVYYRVKSRLGTGHPDLLQIEFGNLYQVVPLPDKYR
jgi:exosome complex RNA-binding protein Rrp4